MDSEKSILKPGPHLSVGETQHLIAQARRIRREYLRASIRELVSWIARRWSRAPARVEPDASPAAENAADPQAKPRPDRLRRAA